MNLALRSLAAAVVSVLFFGALLFGPAGTLEYWQAWVFIVVFTVASLVPSAYIAVRDPAALRRRMKAGPTAETRPVQKLVMVGTLAAVVAVLVLSALDHRFGWSAVPPVVNVAGDVLVAAGLLLAQLVVVQNSWAAATVTVEDGQQLVSTGLYGLVRHPMYTGALVMMAGMPLALDSYWGLVAVALAIPLLAVRAVDEEAMLRADLAGYQEYTRRVRYRLIPYVW
jgi:protein-S-isoprenylcysteine O-methyltransferase Ste14